MSQDVETQEQWFSDEELSLETFLTIFNSDQFRSILVDETIYVHEGFSYPVYLKLDDHVGVMRCRAKAKLKEGYFEPDFFGFLEYLNEESNCTFYLEEDENSGVSYLVSGNFFIKSEGISYKMIISNVIWFLSAFLAGCQVDEDGEFLEEIKLLIEPEYEHRARQ